MPYHRFPRRPPARPPSEAIEREPDAVATPRETEFVTQLIRDLPIHAPAPKCATTMVIDHSPRDFSAYDDEIRAMSDVEFAAYVADEGLSMDHYLVDPLKALRK